MRAAAFMANYSSAGRKVACVRCKQTARWDSIYCSESCRQEFLRFDTKPAKKTAVERWNGTQWVTEFVEVL
jgi:hypothetical protein